MKIAYILIGPSGAGKSTTVAELLKTHAGEDVGIFSLDTSRMNFLGIDTHGLTRDESVAAYKAAFDKANANPKEFDEWVEADWKSALNNDVVIVDNTNVTRKARARWVSDLRAAKTANQFGFKIVMIEFLVPIGTLIERQLTRPDKDVPLSAINQQYFRQESAFLGSECDEVRVVRMDPISDDHHMKEALLHFNKNARRIAADK